MRSPYSSRWFPTRHLLLHLLPFLNPTLNGTLNLLAYSLACKKLPHRFFAVHRAAGLPITCRFSESDFKERSADIPVRECSGLENPLSVFFEPPVDAVSSPRNGLRRLRRGSTKFATKFSGDQKWQSRLGSVRSAARRRCHFPHFAKIAHRGL